MKYLRITFLLLAVTAVASCANPHASPHGKKPFFHKQTITVNGRGEVASRPDMAEIQIAVISASKTGGEAMDKASERAKALIEAATKHGIAASDIRTGTVSLSPLYQRAPKKAEGEEKPPRIIGHRATLSSRITVRNLEVIGKLLDDLVKAGANRLSGINFEVSEREKLANDARALAIKNAKGVAVLMAKEAGVELGAVLRIEDTGSGLPQARMRDMAAESLGMPVVPGEIEVAASVRIVFAIK